MAWCEDCGEYTHTCYGDVHLCEKCYDKREQERIIEQSEGLKETSDFAQWDSGDMSELFWIHLGRYVKEPNAESIKYMTMAFYWACHDNHGIANSFSNALKWAGIDLFAERAKWINK